jgi:hypothetical protein
LNRPVRRIFGPKGDKRVGSWRRLHNGKLRGLYISPNIIRMIKSRRMRWAGYIACMGKRGIYRGFWLESQKEKDHKEDTDIGRRIILKWILGKYDEVLWTGSIWFRIGISRGLMCTL